MKRDKLQSALADFGRLNDVRQLSQDDAQRIGEQPRLVSRFYDVVTRFYEFGWGATFHFSPRRPGESLRESQRRHDEAIGELLRLKPGMHVADIGCGIGGPLVSIARATGASITGINFNSHQIRRGEDRVRRAGLDRSCAFLYADYMNVPLDDGAFDALYSFEALCHAPNRLLAFRELYRLLKPGAEAAIVDWCLTDAYDGANGRHNDIRARIERTNATPELLTAGVTRVLERLRLAPAGTSEAARFLNVAADALVEAGELGIFTPSFLVHARKPA